MAEVSIKAHTRRGKGGKTIQVHGYSRRVGRKGVRSPKKDRSVLAGKELEKKVIEKKELPKVTPEDIARRREFNEQFNRVEAERKSLGMTREQYSRYIVKKLKQDENKKKVTPAPIRTSQPSRTPKGFLEKIEDKVARFVEKYSGMKYKRQL